LPKLILLFLIAADIIINLAIGTNASYQIRLRRNCSFFASAPLSFSPPRGTGRGWGWGCPSAAIMIQTQPETISLVDRTISQAQVRQALPQDKIKEIAEKSTVSISRGGQGLGSGVIIGQRGNTIYVLTAIHVIGRPPGVVNNGQGRLQAEDPYEVITYDGERFLVTNLNYQRIVKKLPNNIDLAVLELKSGRQPAKAKAVAKLAISPLQSGMPVYIFGYLPCATFANGVKVVRSQFSLGNITQQIELSTASASDNNLVGYDVYYNNNTIKGMSGSPLFDAGGRVVAIHAKTENSKEQYNPKACQPLPANPTPDYGNNLGVSSRLLANFKSDLPVGLQAILKIDTDPVIGGNWVTPTPSPRNDERVPNEGVNCGILRGLDDVCPNEQ